MLAGIPLLLGTAQVPAAVAARVARCAGCVALVVVNVAAWAAARRWGVGTHGSLMPWNWDTTHTPVPPIVVLAALAALSIALVAALWTTVAVGRSATTPPTEDRVDTLGSMSATEPSVEERLDELQRAVRATSPELREIAAQLPAAMSRRAAPAGDGRRTFGAPGR